MSQLPTLNLGLDRERLSNFIDVLHHMSDAFKSFFSLVEMPVILLYLSIRLNAARVIMILSYFTELANFCYYYLLSP